jgi:hypothetical protein
MLQDRAIFCAHRQLRYRDILRQQGRSLGLLPL